MGACVNGRSISGTARIGRLARAFGLLLVVLGIAVAAFPFASDVYGRIVAEGNFSQAISEASGYDAVQVNAQMKRAEAFNRVMAGAESDAGQIEAQADNGYESQMTLADEILCWLDVPRLGLKVPVYRGSADEEVVAQRLMEGAVHMRQTSLPVGGASTHAVVTAHSGMRNASMFDNLGTLEPGDRFTLWVYGDALVYEMRSSEVVEPDEVAAHIGIESGRDLVTLVTCTPYGVNSHRLLVHAERVKASPPATTLPKMSDALRSPHVLLFLVALALAILVICAAVLAKGRRRSGNRIERRSSGPERCPSDPDAAGNGSRR